MATKERLYPVRMRHSAAPQNTFPEPPAAVSSSRRLPEIVTLTNEAPPFEPLLDSDEAAVLVKINPKTLQRKARLGEIPGVQIGKLWRFRASVLNEWLEDKMAS